MKYYWKSVLFIFFLISGFSSLLYQVIWIRLAYISFGVITPILSVILSVFMLGLALGSWLGGKYIDSFKEKVKKSALLFYGICELSIALGAWAVPTSLTLSEKWLYLCGQTNTFQYLFLSALAITINILPWSFLMGMTFPLMMSFIKEMESENTTSFGYLYVANVLGASLGTMTTAFVLIELLGFKHSLWVAALLNSSIGLTSIIMSLRISSSAPKTVLSCVSNDREEVFPSRKRKMICALLFLTGFVSMSMEVVWTRAFTIVLGNLTYSFASILTFYLLATFFGSYIYRKHLARKKVITMEALVQALCFAAFIPILLSHTISQKQFFFTPFLVLISITPFCGILGYLTPRLIDRYSEGNPDKGGSAYALNVLGSILGPLAAGYFLLPSVGVKNTMILLTLFLLIFYLFFIGGKIRRSARSILFVALNSLLLIGGALKLGSYEEYFHSQKNSWIFRDHTATVIAFGEGMEKRLLVNGIGMTSLTTITKNMAHMPLAFSSKKAKSALMICFGMGTTFRSLLSWGVEATTVELVPSVKKAFPYYFEDAAKVLENPRGHYVIDDGRRYLMRTKKKFDVITIDPPPPISAAGSSLLYSEDFYEIIKQSLTQYGILQHWFPKGDATDLQAVVRSLTNAFPYVRAFRSMEGWGYHFLASRAPIEKLSTEAFIEKMPTQARKDLMEWAKPGESLESLVRRTLEGEVPIEELMSEDPEIRITDDRPLNEYFIIRTLLGTNNGSHKPPSR